MSFKSDKNVSYKNKNPMSYKSVSEMSEFEENDNIVEEPSDFVIRTKTKKEKDKSSQNKLNESLHSATSQFSKDIFEDKDDEKN